jgi:hypothetical protein
MMLLGQSGHFLKPTGCGVEHGHQGISALSGLGFVFSRREFQSWAGLWARDMGEEVCLVLIFEHRIDEVPRATSGYFFSRCAPHSPIMPFGSFSFMYVVWQIQRAREPFQVCSLAPTPKNA